MQALTRSFTPTARHVAWVLAQVAAGAVWLLVGFGITWGLALAEWKTGPVPPRWAALMMILAPVCGLACWLVRYVGTANSSRVRRQFALIALMTALGVWVVALVVVLQY